MTVNERKLSCTFNDIAPGEVFRNLGEYWMKVIAMDGWNCVRITDGNLGIFAKDTRVTPVACELTIGSYLMEGE